MPNPKLNAFVSTLETTVLTITPKPTTITFLGPLALTLTLTVTPSPPLILSTSIFTTRPQAIQPPYLSISSSKLGTSIQQTTAQVLSSPTPSNKLGTSSKTALESSSTTSAQTGSTSAPSNSTMAAENRQNGDGTSLTTGTKYALGFGIPVVVFLIAIIVLLLWLIHIKKRESPPTGTASSEGRPPGSDATCKTLIGSTNEKQKNSESSYRRRMASALPGVATFQEGDPDNPRNWATKEKIGTALFALLAAFVATFGTPIYISAIPAVIQKFRVDTTLAISPASLYPFGLGIGALLGTAACEIWGRLIVYRVTMPLVFVFTILGGTADNFATLAVSRSLAGLFSGPCITVGVGVLNDIWDISLEKTGTTFAVLFVMVVIWATQVGPIVSAAVIQFGWKWTFWTTAIAVGITMLLSFKVPETYHPQIIRRRAQKLKQPVPDRGSSFKMFLTAVGRPLNMLIVEPIVFPTGLVMAVTQSVVFAYYVEYALLFEAVYKFTPYQVGLAFAPLVVGSLFAIPIVAVCDRLLYQPARLEAIRLGTTVAPEKRLYPAMVGCIILPISLFWLAWTGRKEVHWIVPVLSGCLFGAAYVLNLMCLPIYNNDVYTARYGASVQAASTFMRFAISAAFPLFTAQTVKKLGFAWATSLLGFVTVAMIPIPWIFFKWGPALRKKGRYPKAGD